MISRTDHISYLYCHMIDNDRLEEIDKYMEDPKVIYMDNKKSAIKSQKH